MKLSQLLTQKEIKIVFAHPERYPGIMSLIRQYVTDREGR
jgi:hypothetical protein